MGIIKDFFKSRDKPENTARDKPENIASDNIGYVVYPFGSTTSGQTVTPYNAMQLTAVYACVRVLAENVASLPLSLYRHTEAGKEKAYNHSLYRLLHDEPNSEMTSFNFRETLMHHLLTAGNSYSQIIRNGKGEVLALYPLLPNKMRVTRSSVDRRIYYHYFTDKDGEIVLTSDEVLHIPGLGYDGIIGYSPIAMCKNAIGLGKASEEFGSKFFEGGATPAGILKHPGQLKAPEKVREQWEKTYGNGAHRTAVLEEGMEYQQISISPDEAQFLETRKFQINEICRIFRVPPHMIADLEKSSFNNIEQQSIDFVQNSLTPWLVRIEQAMKKQLLLPAEKKDFFVKHNVNGLLRGDFNTRMQGYATGRQNGWYSANDIREFEDMNRIPAEEGGDEYLCNGNMTRLSDAGNWNEKDDKNNLVPLKKYAKRGEENNEGV